MTPSNNETWWVFNRICAPHGLPGNVPANVGAVLRAPAIVSVTTCRYRLAGYGLNAAVSPTWLGVCAMAVLYASWMEAEERAAEQPELMAHSSSLVLSGVVTTSGAMRLLW